MLPYFPLGVCSHLPNKDRQSLHCSDYNETCTYSCKPGYSGGSVTKTCGLDHQWKGDDLNCYGKLLNYYFISWLLIMARRWTCELPLLARRFPCENECRFCEALQRGCQTGHRKNDDLLTVSDLVLPHVFEKNYIL